MHRIALATLLVALAGPSFAQSRPHGGGVNVALGDGSVRDVMDAVPEFMLMNVYEAAEEGRSADSDGPRPVLMVIANQDFWHVVEHADYLGNVDGDPVFVMDVDGDGREEYLEIELQPVFVTSYQTG